MQKTIKQGAQAILDQLTLGGSLEVFWEQLVKRNPHLRNDHQLRRLVDLSFGTGAASAVRLMDQKLSLLVDDIRITTGEALTVKDSFE